MDFYWPVVHTGADTTAHRMIPGVCSGQKTELGTGCCTQPAKAVGFGTKMELFSQLEKIHAVLATTRLISDLQAKQMTPLVFTP